MLGTANFSPMGNQAATINKRGRCQLGLHMIFSGVPRSGLEKSGPITFFPSAGGVICQEGNRKACSQRCKFP